MKHALALLLFFFLPALAQEQRPTDWATLRDKAEDLYQQGSFASSRKLYLSADASKLTDADRRWLEFRLADTRWRSAVGAETSDSTEMDEAKKSLEEMQRKIDRVEARDRVWALAEESLGDWSWLSRNRRDWGGAWTHYNNALDWWSGARDVATARKKYLAIAFRMSWPDGGKGDSNTWYGYVPIDVAQNAVRIAQDPADKAQAQFLLARTVTYQGGSWDMQSRRFEALRAVIAMGKSTRFYDDALRDLARALEQGEPKVADDGTWKIEPDFVAALATWRRLVDEFKKGESAYLDEARDAIRRILQVEVGVSVGSTFLPGSEASFALSWRNAPRVDLALYAFDLTRAPELNGKDRGAAQWLDTIDVASLEATKTWTYETKDDGRHVPGSAEVRIEPKLAAGAYVLQARAGDVRARELVLVSSTALVFKAVGEQALVWCCDALTSEPVPGADVHLWERTYDGSKWVWGDATKKTQADGTVLFDLRAGSNHDLFLGARKAERQAYATGGSTDNKDPSGVWKIYAFTDRSTYRPKDTIEWKLIARTTDGGPLTTPSKAKLDYEIHDPRGQSVKKGTLTLNEFGAAWASLATDETQPLGEYHVSFNTKGRGVGGATLFRLEEYKLPEYEVAVKPATDDGKSKLYVLGDKVECDVEAAFYSGGPVANADVEVIVRQSQYWRRYTQARDFPWFYDDQTDYGYRWNRGGGQVVLQQKLKTDALGRARVAFDTPRDVGQDFEYTIEARVTDASRREVSGRGTVRVMRREYDVHARTARNLYRPGQKVEIAFDAVDSNNAPVAAKGNVRVTRERWVEVWIDPAGREVSGRELESLRASAFPPPTAPGESAWRCKIAEYVSEEIARGMLDLDAKGQGTFAFTVEKTGYYRAHWSSKDGRNRPIEADAWMWCVKEDSSELGYRTQGLELLVDKDTFVAGENAPVMLSLSQSNRWVLFAVEGQKLHSWQVVHVEGTIKLLTLPIGEAHVPNFVLTAWSTTGGNALYDEKQVVVPPVKQFLDVKVASDRALVQPGSKSTLEITTKNAAGEPVSSELALALVDESVASIQGDYAGDVRQFFYGQKKPHLVQTHSSFDVRRYGRFKLDERGRIVDEREARAQEYDQDKQKDDVAERLDARDGGGKKRGYLKAEGLAGQASAPAAAAPMDSLSAAKEVGHMREEEKVAGNEAAGGEVEVRTDFRETALWLPDVHTDASGRASVEVKYPDSLTRWKATARAVDTGSRVGNGSTTVRADKPLVARLQAPRFFTVGDEALVSGVIDNRTDAALSVKVEILIDGALSTADAASRDVSIPPQGETRVDWRVRAVRAGDVHVTLSAKSREHSDAMAKTYPIQAHGVEVQLARSLQLREGELVATLDVPGARAKSSTLFTLDVAPSLAVTMLDALPYLIDYPYGCTEQTMSRFLPAAIVAHTLNARGLSAEEAMKRTFGGIEPETADKTHPKGKKSLDELHEITRASLERLYDFQHSDGGWGWWKEGGSDAWMSAYVVWGLSLARDAELDVKPGVIERGVNYLELEVVKAERSPELAAWMLHALATAGKSKDNKYAQVAFAKLWEQKDSLGSYGRALFALAAHGFGRTSEARTLIENLANGARVDEHPDESKIGAAGQKGHAAALGTVHWGEASGWWRWHEGAVESTAFALRALATIDPSNPLVQQACNWLVQNRRGAQWNNTRDTAISILALDSFLNATNEVGRDVEYELVVNGEKIAQRKIAAVEMLRAPAHFVVPADKVKDGANEIRLKRVSGEGPLYLAARVVYFSEEEPIPAHGSQIFAKRNYFKLVPRDTLLKGVIYDRVPLEDGGSVRSGERVEVVLTLESKNDYEYLMFEDNKPAGLEAALVKSGEALSAREIKSGEVVRRFGGAQAMASAPDEEDWARFTGRQQGCHQELRDKKVAMFLDRLPQGIWEVRYELRAEVPGRFHALPTMGSAMYVPEIRCNGDEARITVEDREGKGD